MDRDRILTREDAKILVAAKNILARYAEVFDEVSRHEENMPEIRGFCAVAERFTAAEHAMTNALVGAEVRANQVALMERG